MLLSRLLAGALSLLVSHGLAHAQPLGTFRWQLQPFCNVLVLNVTQQGSEYTLDGTDDQCGAAQAASAVGMAFLNPGGSIGIGVTLVTAPGGVPVHVDATIDTASFSGTWRDSAGNTGGFILTPGAAVPGAPRPAPGGGGIPPGSITSVEIATGAVGPSHIAPGAVGSNQLALNAVDSTKVVPNSLTNADLRDEPRLAAATGVVTPLLTEDPQVVRTVSITVPSSGLVLVSATGNFLYHGTGTLYGRCSITTLSVHDDTHEILLLQTDIASLSYVPLAGTRAFSVGPGSYTYRLVCERGNSASNTVSVRHVTMNALFIAASSGLVAASAPARMEP